MDYFKHKTADIATTATIGDGTKLWNNVQIRDCVIIGKNCNIGKDVFIDADVIIGDNVKIQNSVSIYKGVTIESDVFIGPSVAFTNDLYPRAFNNGWVIINTVIKKGSSIGANSTIVCGNTIGEFAMIGAGSVVVCDIRPYSLVVGNPARFISYICRCGNKIDKNYVCYSCHKKYICNDQIICEVE